MQDIAKQVTNSNPTNENLSPSEPKTNSPVIEINHGEQLSPSNSIQVSLIKPSMMESIIGPNDSQQSDQLIRVHFNKTTVKDIKTHISSTWRGKPKTDGIRLIARGRILNDPESVGEALAKSPEDPLPTHPVHVVIRPNAWTEKLAPIRPVSAPPAATTHLSVPTTTLPSSLRSASQSFANLSTPPNAQAENDPLNFPSSRPRLTSLPNDCSNSPAVLFNAYFSALTAYGRYNFLQNILQAQFKIVERLDFLRRQLHNQHLKLLGISHPSKNSNVIFGPNQSDIIEREWPRIEEKLINLLTELTFPHPYSGHEDSANPDQLTTEFDPSLPDECSDFKRVEIAGLPYLLYVPETVSQQSMKEGSAETTSPLKEYKILQRDLNRALRLEAQVQFLILQAQKTEATLNQMEDIISAGLRPHDTPGHDREAQQAQRVFDGLFPPNVFPFPRPPPANGGGPALGLGLGLGPAGDGHHPPNNFMLHNGGPMWQHPMARVRRYEFTINLESIRRYMAPLLWLSLKLSVLLYIFGRHASYSKLVILIMIALGWVIWEAYTIHQRYDAQARRRDRLQRGQQAPGVPAGAAAPAADPIQAVLDRGRRRAERERLQQLLREQRQRVDGILGIENQEGGAAAPNNPPPAPIAAPAQPAGPPAAAEAPVANPPPAPAARRNAGRGGLRAAAADIRARGGAFPPGTEVRPFRSTSAFSPKYWFNSVAVVGLASEYRELGLHSIGERAMGASNLEYPRWYRYLRNLKTGLVLFIGTLLPEIEKKRRKALEKRARILNLVIADAARDTNNHNQNQQQALAQQPRAVGPAAEINNRIATTPPEVPATSTIQPTGSEIPNTRAAPDGEGQENQQTPRALAATALERVGSGNSDQTLSQRRPHLSGSQSSEPNVGPSPLQRQASTDAVDLPSGSHTLTKTSVDESTPRIGSTVLDAPAPSSSSAAPVPGTSTLNTQQHAQDNNPIDNGSIPSPLTPLDAPQVVGGLDDTDDEEIIGAENDEAGMLLF